jgi:glycosyltransferase involved in cell wall biosynthesis
MSERIVVQTRLVADALKPIWPRQVRCVRNYRASVPLPVHGFDPSRIRFIYAGGIRRTKGCGELFQAFAEAKRRIADTHPHTRLTLEMYGQVYSTPCEAAPGIEAARCDPDIAFHGTIANHELSAAYSQADAFIYPTYWPTEGHSGAVLEAMFHGLPILASDWRSNAEIVRHGVNGLIFRHRDVASLVECIVQLAVDVELRRRLAAGALDEARQYDVAIVCPELADALGL